MTDPSLPASISRPAHHRPGGGFRNPWPGANAPRLGAVFKWIWWDRIIRPPPPQPPRGAFRTVAPAFDPPRAPAHDLVVTWFGHSSTLIQVAGLNVLTDPVWSQRASPVPFAGPRRWVDPPLALAALPPVDLVLLSHNHYDHFDRGTIRALAARYPDAQWLAPLGLGPLARATGVNRLRELDWWEEARLGALTVTAVPARHFSARGLHDRNATLWCGWALAGVGRRAYFAGDTGYHPDFAALGRRLGPFDLCLLPIGAYDPPAVMRSVHLDPEEAVRAWRDIQGRAGGVMLGIHWGTFLLTDEPLDEPPRRAREAWARAGLPPGDLWLPVHGETRRIARLTGEGAPL